jgi:biotin transport system substrate-specific component
MADTASRHVLTEAVWRTEGTMLWVKRVALVVLGIAVLTLAAQVKVPVWPSPVLMNLGTFAVLTVAAAYGPRLGLVTMAGWMLLGALGFDVFQSSTASNSGLAYMTGPTGGYLVGYLLATVALGQAARRGWDRSVGGMAAALFACNVLIYVPGLLWLGYLIANGLFVPAKSASVWYQPMAWGLTPFLVGDALMLALAAVVVRGLWKLVGAARA